MRQIKGLLYDIYICRDRINGLIKLLSPRPRPNAFLGFASKAAFGGFDLAPVSDRIRSYTFGSNRISGNN